MDEDLPQQATGRPPGVIEPLTDLEEAQEYAESRVRAILLPAQDV